MGNLVSLKKLLFQSYLRMPLNRAIFNFIKKRQVPQYKIRKYLRFRGIFDLEYRDKAPIRLMNYGNTIENELFWLGAKGWEANALELWGSLCEQSNVILDIGANTGLYTLIASTVNPVAQVYAFEPMPEVFRRLAYNVKLNNINPVLLPFALADVEGQAAIYVADTISETYDQATLNPEHASRVASSSTTIKKKKLDSFIKENGIKCVDLVKLDVETFEPQVMKGFEHYLHEFQPSILIEILNERVADEIRIIVKGLDYEYYRIDEPTGYVRQTALEIPKRGSNFLMLNKKKHTIVKAMLNSLPAS